MTKTEVIKKLYFHLEETLSEEALKIILENDIRVENFFVIHSGIYFDKLKSENKILDYSLQHTIKIGEKERVHIDLRFVDNQGEINYVELKHFSISRNRGNGRRLSFYTSNSESGRKVGIVGDCLKLHLLKNQEFLEENSNLFCVAFITPKPNLIDLQKMILNLESYPEIENWELKFPVEFENQKQDLGFLVYEDYFASR
ncbi:hypothetical protein [Flavobacterium gilvum]|uniref:Uncharacterized protein n=1 Tax=Flavobacterium gilvum TaxID=1492737 RepID=A0AAC9N6V2_9FLAO|nr:hypothetical protein [Flavobacterium gilvum]AOW10722.1 hypothetical protein EM308_15145 [Flavobacterium gilvum]KFC60285.1 hypothetical protein FEM08_08920 [Flavobacterium gilvum]